MQSEETPDEDLIEAGRVLFAGACDFVTGAADLGGLPESEMPEIAFAGRSNVGKSSLINALTRRKALARISQTPGRTRQINFFDLGGRLMLVDLPGYGYAKAPKSEIAAWTRLVRSYLKGRAELRRLCLLVDARHGLKESDRDLMAMLDDAAVVYQLILTKSDKPKSGEMAAVHARVTTTLSQHVAAHPEVIATSARTGEGIAELRAALAALATPAELR